MNRNQLSSTEESVKNRLSSLRRQEGMRPRDSVEGRALHLERDSSSEVGRKG